MTIVDDISGEARSARERRGPAPVGPLAGVVVADFTHILSGPFCTQLLADAGATVIKVEQPGGEYSRLRGQIRNGPAGETLSSYYAAVNRSKRSIQLDLKNPDGRRVAAQLIAEADVVVENFSPGAFARLGFDFARLRAARPELITCSISLFGGLESAGEQLAARGGLSIVAEAESSCGGMLRDAEGTPMGVGIHIGDMGSGLAAYAAVVTALVGRNATGVGQHLDISMVRACLSLNAVSITAEEVNTGRPPLRDPRPAGWGIFGCADGYVAIGINSDSLFHRLCTAMGRPELTTDPRFARHTERDRHVAEVNGMVRDWASHLTTDEVIGAIAPLGVPCGLVATPSDILESPEVARLGFLEEVHDGLGGTLRPPSNPCGFRQPDPALPQSGQHGEELLAELLGISSDGYADLRTRGAFGRSPASRQA